VAGVDHRRNPGLLFADSVHRGMGRWERYATSSARSEGGPDSAISPRDCRRVEVNSEGSARRGPESPLRLVATDQIVGRGPFSLVSSEPPLEKEIVQGSGDRGDSVGGHEQVVVDIDQLLNGLNARIARG